MLFPPPGCPSQRFLPPFLLWVIHSGDRFVIRVPFCSLYIPKQIRYKDMDDYGGERPKEEPTKVTQRAVSRRVAFACRGCGYREITVILMDVVVVVVVVCLCRTAGIIVVSHGESDRNGGGGGLFFVFLHTVVYPMLSDEAKSVRASNRYPPY